MIVLEGGSGNCKRCKKELGISEIEYCEKCLSNKEIASSFFGRMLNKFIRSSGVNYKNNGRNI